MRTIDEESKPEWRSEFDPAEFQRVHQNIELSQWRLDQEQLEAYVSDVMQLRLRFKQKSEAMKMANVNDQ